MFGDCLHIFKRFEDVEWAVRLAADEPAYQLDIVAQKFMIAAFGFGFAMGQTMQMETMPQSIKQVTFEDCLQRFKKIEKAEYLVRLAVDEPTYYLEPVAEKFMIAAFGFGFVIGHGMQTEEMAHSIEQVEKHKDHLIFIYHFSELRRKLTRLGILKPPVS